MAAVASKVVVPKPVFLMDVVASPSASGKTAPSAGCLFNTGGVPPRCSDDGIRDSSAKDAATDRRRERDLSIPKLFTGDMLDPLGEAARPEPDMLLALTGDGVAASASMTGFSPRGCWVSVEVEVGDAVQLKVAMPGLEPEDVKMRVEKDVLVIKGEGDKDSEGDDVKGQAGYSYSYRIGLSFQAFKMDQIKAEMENGVLMVTVPKIKDEERKDVFEIKIEYAVRGVGDRMGAPGFSGCSTFSIS